MKWIFFLHVPTRFIYTARIWFKKTNKQKIGYGLSDIFKGYIKIYPVYQMCNHIYKMTLS